MFEQVFRNIDDALRKEAGCAKELDYAEQTLWLLFLKYLDGLEQDRAMEAGFLREAVDYLRSTGSRTGRSWSTGSQGPKVRHVTARAEGPGWSSPRTRQAL